MPKKKNPIQRGVKAQGPGTTIFLKETLAEKLRDQIMRGNLTPGQRIIESRWARQFDVAQISIREAINLLIADGFVAKATDAAHGWFILATTISRRSTRCVQRWKD